VYLWARQQQHVQWWLADEHDVCANACDVSVRVAALLHTPLHDGVERSIINSVPVGAPQQATPLVVVGG
jgi:hypothetical protein